MSYHRGDKVFKTDSGTYSTSLSPDQWTARMTLLCDLLTDMMNKDHLKRSLASAKQNRMRQKERHGTANNG